MKKGMEILNVILAVFLMLGIKLLFSACPEGEDGYMACHWAEQAVFALSIVLFIQAFFLAVIQNGAVKTGIALAILPTAVITAILPGGFIRLCMMDTMRCHTLMRPAVMICAILIAAVSFFVLVKTRRGK